MIAMIEDRPTMSTSGPEGEAELHAATFKRPARAPCARLLATMSVTVVPGMMSE